MSNYSELMMQVADALDKMAADLEQQNPSKPDLVSQLQPKLAGTIPVTSSFNYGQVSSLPSKHADPFVTFILS